MKTGTPSTADQLVEFLWGRRTDARRGPKPSLTVDQIVSVAMAVADRDGIDTVSMHGIAEELGYSKMALYRYFPSKEELLAALVDAAVGEPPSLQDVAGGWRRRVEAYAEALFATWQQHPWLPGVTIGARVMGPNEVAWAEACLAAFDGTGLTGRERIDATLLISAHVRTTHSLSTAGSFPWDERRQLNDSLVTVLNEHRDRYPAILAAIDSPTSQPISSVHDGIGLGCILDGLERRIASRDPDGPAT